MMYEEIGLEPIESAASDESVPAAGPFCGILATGSVDPLRENLLDERLIRIIKAFDR